MKFEVARFRIHFLRDVFVAVAVGESASRCLVFFNFFLGKSVPNVRISTALTLMMKSFEALQVY